LHFAIYQPARFPRAHDMRCFWAVFERRDSRDKHKKDDKRPCAKPKKMKKLITVAASCIAAPFPTPTKDDLTSAAAKHPGSDHSTCLRLDETLTRYSEGNS
jgi:hypothetical protein